MTLLHFFLEPAGDGSPPQGGGMDTGGGGGEGRQPCVLLEHNTDTTHEAHTNTGCPEAFIDP